MNTKHLLQIILLLLLALCLSVSVAEAAPKEQGSQLSAPSSLVATTVSHTEIKLTWVDNNKNEKGFTLLRSTSPAFNPNLEIDVLGRTKREKSYTDSGLDPATTYYYKVQAYNANNTSPYSDDADATTEDAPGATTTTTTTTTSTTTTTIIDTTPPSVPEGLTANVFSCSQINLSWDASTDTGGSGLKGYNVYRNGWFLKIVLAPFTSTSDTTVTESTFYSYTVRAIDNANNESVNSNTAADSTPACSDTIAPTAPTGLTASAVDCSQINLSWNASTDTGGSGLKGYNVYRDGSFLKIVLVPSTSTSDTTVAESTFYSYTVRAIDNANNESANSNTATDSTPECGDDTIAPTAPTGLTASAVDCGQINLSWNESTDTGGSGLRWYRIYRNGSLRKIVFAPSTSTSDTGLAESTTYSFNVVAEDNAGNLSADSDTATETTPPCSGGDTIAPTVPTGLTANEAGCNQINLSWDASTDTGGSGLKGYRIYRNSLLVKVVFAPSTSTSDTTVAESTFYSYTVRAIDNAINESVDSNTATEITPACDDTTPPSIPTGLTANEAGCDQINLSWNESTDTGGSGLKGYNVYRNGLFLKFVTSTSTSDMTVEASTSYIYAVNAIDNAGNISAISNTAYDTTPECNDDTIAPTVPTGLTANEVSCSQINLSWNASTDTGGSGLKGYNVYRDGSFLKFVTSTSTSDMTVAASTFYSYTVSAIDNADNESSDSLPATEITPSCGGNDMTPPSVPTGLTANEAGCDQINLSWNASTDTGGSGLKGYNVYRNAAVQAQVLAPSTSYSDTGLAASTFYSYNVTAIDNASNESYMGNLALENTPSCGNNGGEHLWSQSFFGNNYNLGYNVAVDGSNNVLVTGSFRGNTDFGGGLLTSAGSYDIFVAKYTANGTHLWSKALGGTYTDYSMAIAVDNNYDVVVTGYFTDTVDFGGGTLTSAGSYDIFLAKYASNGTHLWSKRFGSTSADLAYSMAVDVDGNIVLTGYFRGSVDFGGGSLTSAGGYDIFVAKYTTNGTHLWSKRFGGSLEDLIRSVAVDSNGNIVITGYFTDTADFGGIPLTSAGNYDIFVAKYTANGAHLWSKRFGSTGRDEGRDVAVDVDGNIVLTGYFRGSVDFGGGMLVDVGGGDIFVAKYSSLGTHLWSKRFGSVFQHKADFPSSVAVDGNGNMTLTGSIVGTISFGGEILLSGSSMEDIFVAKLSGDGSHIWSHRFGEAETDRGVSVACDTNDNTIVTGFFSDAVDFGGGQFTTSVLSIYNSFLVKFAP